MARVYAGRFSSVLVDPNEPEDPPPRVGARIPVLVVALVEERVRGSLIRHDLVRHLAASSAVRNASTASAGIAWSAPPKRPSTLHRNWAASSTGGSTSSSPRRCGRP